MVFVAGVNGLLGSRGVATLCIHGFEFLHLTAGNHDEKHSDCEEHSCEDSENEQSDAAVVTDLVFVLLVLNIWVLVFLLVLKDSMQSMENVRLA